MMHISLQSTLCKVSFKYWKHNKGKLAAIMIAVAIGAAAISAAALFVRSEKSKELDDLLNYHGNYDAIFTMIDNHSIEKIINIPSVCDYGVISELGYASEEDYPDHLYKVASFADKHSEDLYHMKCMIGRYPVGKDEVAVDVSFLRNMGMVQDTGGKIKLSFQDMNGNHAFDKEFTICGVFEASNNDAAGGWYRFTNLSETDKYDMPVIYVSNEWSGVIKSNSSSLFIQYNSSFQSFFEDLKALEEQTAVEYLDFSGVTGRSGAYSVILGRIGLFDISTDMNSIDDSVKRGDVIKDFYSSIMIPVYCVCIAAIVIALVHNAFRIVFENRRGFYGILRSCGATRKECSLYVALEMFVITIVSAIIGAVLGLEIHLLLISFVNNRFNLNLLPGINCDKYVESITLSPWVLSIVSMIVACLFAVIPLIIRIVKSYPVALLIDKNSNKSKTGRYKSAKKQSWLSLINRRIDLHSISVLFIMIIVMSLLIFGYVLFSVLSDKDTAEYRSQIIQSGLTDCDYSVHVTDDLYEGPFGAFNHHNYGINEAALNDIVNQPWVEKQYAEVFNSSTRISYIANEQPEEISLLLNEANLRYQPNEDDGIFAQYYQEGNNIIIRKAGYSDDENIYQIPTLGLGEDSLTGLDVVAGSINIDKIAFGEEVVIAVPSRLSELAQKCFPVNYSLPLSDLIMTSDEERLRFGYLTEKDVQHDYDAYVKMEDGSEINVFAFGAGNRKNIHTRVGAIVSLDEEQENQLLHGFNVVILCYGNRTFKKWGLPDINYTSFKVKLKDGYDFEDIDKQWNKILSQSRGIELESTYLIHKAIFSRNIEIMTIYFIIAFMLVITGSVAVAIGLYTKLLVKRDILDSLRMIGMSNLQIIKAIITQNLFYPVCGALAATIPVAACQFFFIYIRRKIDSGEWMIGVYTPETGIPWYSDIPFQYNLFEYGFFKAFAMSILIGFVLIMIGTVSQFVYISRHKMINE